jgi:putative ABC transport system permease protein
MADLKFALRRLLKNPGFTTVAVLTLALGIGANTAIFSVVNAVLLRPLPYPDPHRLVAVCESNPGLGWNRYVTSMGAYSDWRDQTSSFQELAGAIVLGPTPALCRSGTEMVRVAAVSANFFPLLGIQPILGRPFTIGEESPANGNVVLLSELIWRKRFGADPDIINRTIRLGDRDFAVAGVMPASLRLFDPSGVQGWDSGFSRCDLWRPLPVNSGLKRQRNYRAFLVLGRLKKGVTLDRAQAEMTAIAQDQAAQFRESNAGWEIRVQPWRRVVVQQARQPLLLVFAAVGVVLLIMTVNLANLHLARATTRERELAVRMALGAGRLRMIRQFLAESLLLSCLGGVMGLVLAHWSLQALVGLIPAAVPRTGEISLDGRVLGFSLAVSLVVGSLFGLIPALMFLRGRKDEGRRLNCRGLTPDRSRHVSRSALVMSQVALVMVLVSGAALLVRSFWRLSGVDPGFRPEHLLAVDTLINGSRYTNGFARVQAVQSLLGRLAARSALGSFAAADGIPLDSGRGNRDIALTSLEGRLPAAPGEKRIAGLRLVSSDYFGIMGIPLQRGRFFNDHDTTNTVPVVIINETFARRYFAGIHPVGKRIASPDFGGRPCEVVGVVGDVRHKSLDLAPEPEVFRPLLQECFSSFTIIANRSGPVDTTLDIIRKEVAAVDGQWPVYNTRRLERLVTDSTATKRFALVLMELFAGLALVMAFVGIQGVLASVVGERRREVAIRLAVGAQRHAVVRLVLGHGMWPVTTGILVGWAGLFVLGRFLRGQLYEIGPTDPLTIGVVGLLMFGVAGLACWLPARRATKVNPMEALRYE